MAVSVSWYAHPTPALHFVYSGTITLPDYFSNYAAGNHLLDASGLPAHIIIDLQGVRLRHDVFSSLEFAARQPHHPCVSGHYIFIGASPALRSVMLMGRRMFPGFLPGEVHFVHSLAELDALLWRYPLTDSVLDGHSQ